LSERISSGKARFNFGIAAAQRIVIGVGDLGAAGPRWWIEARRACLISSANDSELGPRPSSLGQTNRRAARLRTRRRRLPRRRSKALMARPPAIQAGGGGAPALRGDVAAGTACGRFSSCLVSGSSLPRTRGVTVSRAPRGSWRPASDRPTARRRLAANWVTNENLQTCAEALQPLADRPPANGTADPALSTFVEESGLATEDVPASHELQRPAIKPRQARRPRRCGRAAPKPAPGFGPRPSKCTRLASRASPQSASGRGGVSTVAETAPFLEPQTRFEARPRTPLIEAGWRKPARPRETESAGG